MSEKRYQVVIGLEIHVQLNTKTKIFSPDPATYGDLPNENIGVVSLAHPGTLPKLNRKVIGFAAKLGLACHCDIARQLAFDRKNYFYPDLPKGYQLTQNRLPIGRNGYVSVRLKEGHSKRVRLANIHLEEDSGKSIHDAGGFTLVDYNRAGMPLIELVTRPEIQSTEEAMEVLHEVRRIVRYLGVSDGDMEKGSMRCDANISVIPPGRKGLGEKVEIKNMNSIRNVGRAIAFESNRQIRRLENDQRIIAETRKFDVNEGTTSSMRIKEELSDYRYFPEPDLGLVEISDEDLAVWKTELPRLPGELFDLFTDQYKLPTYDAGVLIEEQSMAAYAHQLFEKTRFVKQASNWLMGPVKSWLNDQKSTMEYFPITVKQMIDMLELIQQRKVGHSNAVQKLFPFLLENPEKGVSDACKQLNLLLEQNDSEIQLVIDEILTRYPDKVKAYQEGRKGLLGMFMGELMKKTKSKVDAQVANKMLRESLKPGRN